MTLPIYPAPITLVDIRNEFGETGEVTLTDYYAGAGIVPAGTVGYPNGVPTPIPTSGAISLQNFHGASSISIVEIQSSGNWQVPAGVTSIYTIMVGGGGGGGAGNGADGGGGGGAGAVLITTAMPVTPLSYIPVVIGAGGAGTPLGSIQRGAAGTTTSFDGYNAIGGGGGGGSNAGQRTGGSGGSGGGACGYGGDNAGGNCIAPGLGNNGGRAGRYNSGGGGGGRSAVGQGTADQEGTETTPGKGGSGYQLLLPIGSRVTPWTWDGFNGIYGTPYTTSSITLGGGGGGGRGSSVSAGIGGSGIGGIGGNSRAVPATNGTVRTGSGGGGGYADAANPAPPGGNGSSGTVFIIYETPTRTSAIRTFDSAVDTKCLLNETNLATVSGFTMNTNGTISVINTPSASEVSPTVCRIRNTVGTNWYSTTTPGIGSSFWVRVSREGNSSGTGTVTRSGTFDTWINLTSNQTWSLSALADTANSIWAYDILTIQIAETSGGPVIAGGQVQLTVLSTGPSV